MNMRGLLAEIAVARRMLLELFSYFGTTAGMLCVSSDVFSYSLQVNFIDLGPNHRYCRFMAGKIAEELKQRQLDSLEQEAALNLLRTSQVFDLKTGEFLRQFGLTSTQFNVLRILRGAGESGLACSQIAERMITHDSDVTRLLDRMESGKLVLRARSCSDRRLVSAKITADGLALLRRMDKPLAEHMRLTLGTMKKERLHNLIDLLEELRGKMS